jgi:hypothetical protein
MKKGAGVRSAAQRVESFFDPAEHARSNFNGSGHELLHLNFKPSWQ